MIAYLTHTYPNYSTTFTRAELDRLDVVPWSLRRPPEAFLTGELRGEIDRAAAAFASDVKARRFPAEVETYFSKKPASP